MDLALRAVVIYVLVFVFTRALGRRELSTLQPFDLILLVVIGDLVQSGVTQNDLSVTGVLLVVCTIGILQVAISYLSFRFRRIRPVLQGERTGIREPGAAVDPIHEGGHAARPIGGGQGDGHVADVPPILSCGAG